MKLANRCPKCGGIANHLVTDIFRRPFYKCMMGLTTRKETTSEDWEGTKVTGSDHIVACETIIDGEGKVVTGTIAYDTNCRMAKGKVVCDTKTLGVTEGKERR